jgi:drug/metabolite transporter (DMT)-like permease
MEAKLSPGTGVVILLAIATTFGANHVAARVAFDHGATVSAAVAVRSGATALVLLALLHLQKVPLAMPLPTFGRAILAGLLVAVQSFCLYSAVARIPVALALLVFSTFAVLYVLLSWALGRETPPLRALAVMPMALLGLALALDLRMGALAGRWADIGAGASFAFAGACSFALAMYFNVHWLKAVDGRARTFLAMAVTAAAVLAVGLAMNSLLLPADVKGWLGLALLALFYGVAITTLFIVLPRLQGAATTVALNFEPIAVLLLAWVFLDQAVAPLQIVGALLVVGAIAWLGAAKR